MKEIGGYIEFEYNHGKMLHENAILLNCGRRAFSYLIKSKGINKDRSKDRLSHIFGRF